MEGVEGVEPVGEVVYANFLRNLLRLAQLQDPDVKKLVALVREEEVVEKRLSVFTAKLQEERLLVLVVDVVHQMGDHLRFGDEDRDERHVALRRFRVGDLDAILVVIFHSCEAPGTWEALEVCEECLGDCGMYWHLDPNLVVAHRAHIASSPLDEVEDVRRRELLGPWRAHAEAPVRDGEGPRLFYRDMLRGFPSTGVRSSATAHEEEDPSKDTHRLPKRLHLPRNMAGSKPPSF